MAELTEITTDHTEILEAALGAFEEGIAVLDGESRVLLWNHAAAAISGYQSAEMLSRGLPATFYREDEHARTPHEFGSAERPLPVHLLHHQGHTLPAMLRRTPLRNTLGKRFGTLLRFHPADEMDALPRGETDDDGSLGRQIEQSQAALEERLDEAWQEWKSSAAPFGLLWITVDQAAMLRKTHGRDACEAMLDIVERTLLHTLLPAEILGRWGTHEFLVLCHERSAEMLEMHAQHLGTVAKTADFRWWGDRIAISVSIGTAQAEEGETLSGLLTRAQREMLAMVVGSDPGPEKTRPGGQACSQS
jgi:diguanylate cyclase (GGDEF)-like protein/PAS domain S-box-containing protein